MAWHKIALGAAFVIFLVLNILDLASTIIGLSRGLVELNPVARFAMSTLGEILGLVLLKVVFVVMIGTSIVLVIQKTPSNFFDDDVMLTGLALLNILGFFVLSNNLDLLGWNIPVHVQLNWLFNYGVIARL